LGSDFYNIGMIPDWQLPPGVDRGLHDYMNSTEMVAGYGAMMAASPLAELDVRFCAKWFAPPGRVIDLGCGTGRLAKPMTDLGHEYVGVDLSEEMLRKASRPFEGSGPDPTLQRVGSPRIAFLSGNLVELPTLPVGPFDYAACLFSTLGMIVGDQNRRTAVANVFQLLKPGGVFVLHVHNRYFRELGFKGLRTGDITMSQAYGGAPLTLHHFGRREAVGLLKAVGFRVLEVLPVAADGELRRPWLFPARRAYGYLIAAISEPDA